MTKPYRGSVDIVTRLQEKPLPSLNRIVQDREDAANLITTLRQENARLNEECTATMGEIRTLREELDAALRMVEAERALNSRFISALDDVRKTLIIPAAEYVPAIPDAWEIIDRALAIRSRRTKGEP